MKFRSLRRFFYEIHLWLGIASGIILFIVCLSGTIYVFRDEAQRIAEPAKYYVDVPQNATAMPADDLIDKIEKECPEMVVSSLTIPEKTNRTVTMSLMQKPVRGGTGMQGRRPGGERPSGHDEGRGGQGGDGIGRGGGQGGGRGPAHGGGGGHGRNMIYVDPYTGDIVGEGANVVDPFFMSMMRLHRFLWLPINIGRPIVGIATIIFVVLCLTGFVLWLPRTWTAFKKWKGWKPGLRIRFRKGIWPLMYDLHNSIGFYMLIPALILALTGLCWSFSWYRNATSYVLGDQVFKQRGQRPEMIEPVEDSIQPLSVGEMIARQNRLTPGSGEIFVSIPQDRETAMVIQKGRTGFFALAIKDKTQWDRFRGTPVPVEHHGKTVDVERFADKPFGAKLAVSIRAVHFGDITGMSSKLFFFVVCLFATSFPVTGVALWIKKLRVKRRAAGSVTSSENNPQEQQPGTQ